jgi:serine/threonine protein phosphatase PrpC
MNWILDAALVTDTGVVRDSNEDAGRIVQPGDVSVLASHGVLAIVADGMGGHLAGEVASGMAVDIVHRRYYEAALPQPAAGGDIGAGINAALVGALAAANRAIYDRAAGDSRHAGMGTTCVALAICGDHAYASHAGDSRLYLIRGGGIYQLTNDDSAVGEMVSRGLLSREAARRHEDRNVILKALGTHPTVDASAWPKPLAVLAGDAFLLCTDGLTDLVEEEELADIARGDRAADACHRMVELAKSRGGFDNITVAMLRFAPQPAAHTPLRETREVRVTS